MPEGAPPEMMLSVLGVTGLTAYFGLLDLGDPQPGETVLVSGAAGATGSVAGQIAKIKDCRVVGIAGGPEKCAWLTEEAGFDHAIDYKQGNLDQQIAEASCLLVALRLWAALAAGGFAREVAVARHARAKAVDSWRCG